MVQEMNPAPKVYLDGTFGRGGHAMSLVNAYPSLKVFAIDRDPEAIDFAKKHYSEILASDQLVLLRGNFHDINQLLEKKYPELLFDLILIDLGVSSPQLDQPERGFSFYHNGPLDMRMDPDQKISAQEIINQWDEEELVHLFIEYGEVRKPYKVVNEIIKFRNQDPFKTTRQLSSLIEKTEGWRKKGQHPATKYFLALRMKVNDELDPLGSALESLVERLNDKGRLIVLTFHSLEDRIVKLKFKSFDHLGWVVNKKVLQAQWAEKKKNSRARSAKLRAFQRGENPNAKTKKKKY